MHRNVNWLILATLLPLVGCMSFANFVLYATNGMPKVPAEFDELKGKRVAVVCVSTSNAYGPGTMTAEIARQVHGRLRANIEEIDVVKHEEISDWMDRNDWNRVEYEEVGRGVKADMVVAIELNQPLTLRDGPTLFRGHADFTVTVLDMKQDGKKVFRRREEEFRWPQHGRYGITESQFEKAFVRRVSGRAGQFFYPFEENSEIGADSSDVSGL